MAIEINHSSGLHSSCLKRCSTFLVVPLVQLRLREEMQLGDYATPMASSVNNIIDLLTMSQCWA